MASFTAAGTSYATHGEPMIPFFAFYSMFGFQRIGDLIWSAGDQRARGFLLGATYGRTTLNGEGLQHEDGHSLLLATTNPVVPRVRPGLRLRGRDHRQGRPGAHVRRGGRRGAGEDVFYYLTLYNENYAQPEMPTGVDEGIVKGLYRFADGPATRNGNGDKALRAQLLASGHDGARRRCARRSSWPKASTSRRRCGARRRTSSSAWTPWRRALEPAPPDRAAPRAVRRAGAGQRRRGRSSRSTDSMRAVPDQIARWVHQPFVSLGTDGFGRSDQREALRRFFEIDAEHIVVAVLGTARGDG